MVLNATSYDTPSFQYFSLPVISKVPYIQGKKINQIINFNIIADINKNVKDFTPVSDKGLAVDVMVKYGPARAIRQSDGSYKIQIIESPLNIKYPVKVNLIATQPGQEFSEGINVADPVEKSFNIFNY